MNRDLEEVLELLQALGGVEMIGAEFVALIALQGVASSARPPHVSVEKAFRIGDAFVAEMKRRRSM